MGGCLLCVRHRPGRNLQALAESMGIDTDWNCAISLRPLEDSTKPDPHRMTSDYADWDVKVWRSPHLPLSLAAPSFLVS